MGNNFRNWILASIVLGIPFLSFLVQREQSKQYRKIEDGSKEQLPCRSGGHSKGKARTVAEKGASENNSATKINDSRLTPNCRTEGHCEKRQGWKQGLPGDKAILGLAFR